MHHGRLASVMIFLGIDPGIYGAIAALDDDGQCHGAWPCPVQSFHGKEMADPRVMQMLVSDIATEHHVAACAIEQPVAVKRSGQQHGADSGYAKLVESQGVWMLAVRHGAGKHVAFGHPTPTKWQSSITARCGGLTPKARSEQYAAGRWPGVLEQFPAGATERSIATQVRTGVTDALCLAEMCRRAWLIGGADAVEKLGRKARMR